MFFPLYQSPGFSTVLIELNLKGTFRVARACARPMVEQGRGSIILMSSMRAVNVEPGQSIYASTKAGIGQLTRGIAVELGPFGVRVNALAPGIVATPLTRPITSNPTWNEAYAKRTALGRWAEPEEMAGPIMFLVGREQLSHRYHDLCRCRLDSDRRALRAAVEVVTHLPVIPRNVATRNPL